MTFLSFEEWQATEAKVAKIMKRAKGKGFTGKLEVTAEPAERKTVSPSGLTVTERGYDVEVKGTPVKFAGWTLAARVEWQDGEPVLFTVPGTDFTVNRGNLRPGECAHCGQDRNRIHTFVVRHDDGREVQVGSTCIKDFLGWDALPCWHDLEASANVFDGIVGTAPAYDVETVLAFAWAAIKVNGFTRTSDYGYSTKAQVIDAIDPRDARSRETSEAIRPHVADAADMAKRVRDWLLSLTDREVERNDYLHNLRTIARGDAVTCKMFGYLVSAPTAYERAQGKLSERKADAAKRVNEWLGTLGERITVKATIKARYYVAGYMGGSVPLYVFTTDTGHEVKWFCNSAAEPFGDSEVEEHVTVELTGTVDKRRGHDEYNGRKSTRLTRCTVKR